MFSSKMAVPELCKLIFNRKWPEVIDKCKSNPEEAQYCDIGGWTALHLACSNNAPLDVVQALLKTNPDATCRTDEEGRTPLHVCCWEQSVSPDILRLIIESDDRVIDVKDLSGRTALMLLYNTHRGAFAEAQEVSVHPSFDLRETIANDSYISVVWEKALVLVKRRQRSLRSTHFAMALKNDTPLVILRLIMSFFSEELVERDEEGNVSLHLAAAVPITFDWENEHDILSRGPMEEKGVWVLEELLKISPNAASIRNNKEELPLKVASSAGRRWNYGFKIILDAYPPALESLVTDDRFYPEVLSFIGRNTGFATLYQIVRARPHMIENALDGEL